MIGFREMLERADAVVASVEVCEAAKLLSSPEVVFVDVRDPRELLRDGVIPGVRKAPRGMLEFWIDPASPYHKPWFGEEKTFVFYCASGWRSLLAAELAQQMGLESRSLRGGFAAWCAAGLPTVAPRTPTATGPGHV